MNHAIFALSIILIFTKQVGSTEHDNHRANSRESVNNPYTSSFAKYDTVGSRRGSASSAITEGGVSRKTSATLDSVDENLRKSFQRTANSPSTSDQLDSSGNRTSPFSSSASDDAASRKLVGGSQSNVNDLSFSDIEGPARPSFGDFQPNCVQLAQCWTDTDCGKGGRCVGTFVATCDCSACEESKKCNFDYECGALRGACDWESQKCRCSTAFRKLNVQSDVFCQKQPCGKYTDACYGLPCSKGKCMCS